MDFHNRHMAFCGFVSNLDGYVLNMLGLPLSAYSLFGADHVYAQTDYTHMDRMSCILIFLDPCWCLLIYTETIKTLSVD